MDLKPEGQAFFRYSYNISNYDRWDPRSEKERDNEFIADRIRLGLRAGFMNSLFARIALDALPTDEDWEIFPSYAFFQVRPASAFQISAGILSTSYIEFLNDAYGYRYILPTAYEIWTYRRALTADFPIPTTDSYFIRGRSIPLGSAQESDLGMVVSGHDRNDYVDYRLGLYNGEGPQERDEKGGKAVDARLSIYPLRHVSALSQWSVTGFGHYEKVDPESEEWLKRLGVLFHYRYSTLKNRPVNFGVEFDSQVYSPHRDASSTKQLESFIFSLFWDVGLVGELKWFFRYDFFDPNIKNGSEDAGWKDELTLIMQGFSYDFSKNLAAALSFQMWSTREEKFDKDKGDGEIFENDFYLSAHTVFQF